ncbi:MAG TPA: hypothetical protein VHK90_11015 [Thermoanaerobaculia bacterium]|nr:hypothetical protein [Thermoanaerobaculia bacterium]
MKASAAILAIFLVAGSALAQDSRNERRPDYSRETLQRLFIDAGEFDDGLQFRDGAVRFGAFGTTFDVNIPRILAPLSGSVIGVTQSWPDPFALTNTQIATSRRAWRTQRAVNAELRRIEAMDRARLRVNTR